MFRFIVKTRFLLLAAALSLFLGGAKAQAQGQPKPVTSNKDLPVTGKSYVFTLENFQILHTRSLHNDTDHVSIALKVGDKVYPAKVKHMGNVNDGTHKVNLSFDPVVVPTPETKIVLTYLIMNSGHKEDKISEWLQKGSEELLKKEASAEPGLGEVVSYLGKLGIKFLFPNCDGWVAGDHITLTGKTLATWGASHKETRNYPGIDSPRGCGSNSHYKVTWSVSLK